MGILKLALSSPGGRIMVGIKRKVITWEPQAPPPHARSKDPRLGEGFAFIHRVPRSYNGFLDPVLGTHRRARALATSDKRHALELFALHSADWAGLG